MDGLRAHLAAGEVVDEGRVRLGLGHVVEPAREAVPPVLQERLRPSAGAHQSLRGFDAPKLYNPKPMGEAILPLLQQRLRARRRPSLAA